MLKGRLMFNSEEFINDFVAAAKENNDEKMKELADKISTETLEFRTQLLSDLVDAMKDSEANAEVEAGLAATLQLMQLALEAQDSAGEEAKDNTKAEEATQDVAADTSAAETEGDSKEAEAVAETETSEEAEGEAPAKEEEAEKTEA